MGMASLDASLLARKGTAKPSSNSIASFGGSFETPAQVPAQKPERRQPAEVKTKPGKQDFRIKKTLHLDSEMNKMLRLLAAKEGITQQKLMQRAVIKLIEDEMGNCACVGKALRS